RASSCVGSWSAWSRSNFMGARYAPALVPGASRSAASYAAVSMGDYVLPRHDEPFDFRHQAAIYGRFRRDYSDALYAALLDGADPGGGELAVDVGCGTGFVTASLRRRGWRAIGVDFSAPMLAQARAASARALPGLPPRRECPPLRDPRARPPT